MGGMHVVIHLDLWRKIQFSLYFFLAYWRTRGCPPCVQASIPFHVWIYPAFSKIAYGAAIFYLGSPSTTVYQLTTYNLLI